jgi:glyoxylase-like metal-dependent hydrolase (beta-lactamase superfamily II)
MMRIYEIKKVNFFLLFFILAFTKSYSFDIKVKEISDKVKIFSGGVWNENIVAIASQKGLVIIDAPFSRSVTLKFQNAIEKEFGRDDFIYLINTHSCFCHVGGNQVYKKNMIIGHENLLKEMQQAASDTSDKWSRPSMIKYTNDYIKYSKDQLEEKKDEKERWEFEVQFWKQVKNDYLNGHEIVPPNILFKDRLTINLGDITIKLYNFNYSHSKSSILVFIPEAGLLIEHGIFNKDFLMTFPIDEDTPSNLIENRVSTLKELLEEDKIKYVLDIHGEGFKTIEDVRADYDYFDKLLNEFKIAFQEGLTIEEIQNKLSIESSFIDFKDLLYSAENIENMWKLLNKN